MVSLDSNFKIKSSINVFTTFLADDLGINLVMKVANSETEMYKPLLRFYVAKFFRQAKSGFWL